VRVRTVDGGAAISAYTDIYGNFFVQEQVFPSANISGALTGVRNATQRALMDGGLPPYVPRNGQAVGGSCNAEVCHSTSGATSTVVHLP
jgi:hypothetical protein